MGLRILSATGWSAWGSWTQCTSTCGSGIHTRYRTCNNTLEFGDECEGVQYVQQAVCTLDDCPGKLCYRNEYEK